MILDDINYDLYFHKRNKKIELTRFETTILLCLIKNRDRRIRLEEFVEYIYGENSFTNVYKDSFQSTIYRLNQKMYPYAKIVAKPRMGYSLKESEYYFEKWKNNFFDTHEDEKELIKLYKKKENLEKNIKILEKRVT